MTNALGFGVIGCGAVSRVHIQQIQEIEDARLVAVSDMSEEAAKRVGESAGVPWYTDYKSLLERKDIDVVTIATPSGTHADMIVAAAEAGKHVLVEKPIDISLEKAERAIATCRFASVKLGVVSQHRFDKSTIEVKRCLQSGELGNIFLVQAAVNWYRSQDYYDRSIGAGTWEMDGGGVLMIQALHTIDIVQHLLGPVAAVNAKTLTATHQRIEVEDTAVATFTFKSGAIGTLSATTGAFPGLSTRIELFGSLGTAIIENDDLTGLFIQTPSLNIGTNSKTVPNQAQRTVHHNTTQAHRLQIEDMIQAIRDDREPMVNGEESLSVLRLILAMYQSAKSASSIFLN